MRNEQLAVELGVALVHAELDDAMRRMRVAERRAVRLMALAELATQRVIDENMRCERLVCLLTQGVARLDEVRDRAGAIEGAEVVRAAELEG